MRAQTGSGEVTGSGVAGGRLRLKTGSGDVRVAATGTPDDVLADTGSGEVNLTLPDAVYAVSTDTGSGESRVTVRTDPGASRRVRGEDRIRRRHGQAGPVAPAFGAGRS